MRSRLVAVLLALGLLTGCASTPRPDALALTAGLSNALADGLALATERHEQRLAASIEALAAACPDTALAELLTCYHRAAALAHEQAAPERAQLSTLALLQRQVVAGLRAAQACRRDGLDCEERELRAVEGVLASARAALARLQGTPAPPTGDAP